MSPDELFPIAVEYRDSVLNSILTHIGEHLAHVSEDDRTVVISAILSHVFGVIIAAYGSHPSYRKEAFDGALREVARFDEELAIIGMTPSEKTGIDRLAAVAELRLGEGRIKTSAAGASTMSLSDLIEQIRRSSSEKRRG